MQKVRPVCSWAGKPGAKPLCSCLWTHSVATALAHSGALPWWLCSLVLTASSQLGTGLPLLVCADTVGVPDPQLRPQSAVDTETG